MGSPPTRRGGGKTTALREGPARGRLRPGARRLFSVPLLVLASCAASSGPSFEGPGAAVASEVPPPSWIDAGPLLGHVSHSEAHVWVRPEPGVELAVEAEQDGRPLAPRVEVLGGGCRRVSVGGLVPSRRVTLVLRDAGRAGDADAAYVLEFDAAPAPSRSGTVRLAIGSCIDDAEHGPVPVLGAAARERPDAFLFLGDNCYYVRGAADPEDFFSTSGEAGEWGARETMLARQLSTRREAHVAKLVRTVPSYAIWDDHDYATNNADGTFEGKAGAREVFCAVWANPSYGRGGEGIFSSFRRGPVEVFLMDGRWFRTPEETPDERAAIWGEEQTKWLLDGLARSDAPLKVVANGTQLLFKGKRDDGHWHAARREYYRFLDGLETLGIDGVVLVSGDRHYSELMRVERADGRALYEFTSSPLQQGRDLGPHDERNPTRVWAMEGNAYGLLTVTVAEDGTGSVTFECRDEHDAVPVILGTPMRTTIPLTELGVGGRDP